MSNFDTQINDKLKDLSSQINQKVTARLAFKNYKKNLSYDGTYSVYSFRGESSVNKTYSFIIKFISDFQINIEELVDTDIKLNIDDENSSQEKTIYGKIFKASQDSVVASKFMYEIEVVSPAKYLDFNNRYEIYHQKRISEIIVEVFNRYSALLNIQIEEKIDLKTAPIREYTTQYNQSDLEFITMLCEEEGYSLIYHYSYHDKDFFKEPYLITICELNEHCKIITNSATGSFNKSKQFSPSYIIEDYYDEDKPSLEMKTSFGSQLQSETLLDNQSTSQLRADIKKNIFRDKLNILDESLFKDLKRYNKNDSYASFAQERIIKGSSQELYVHDCMSIELHDEKANKNFDVIILRTKYEGFFPNALENYIEEELSKDGLEYEVSFTAIPKDIIYKPSRTIYREKIHGVQTAIVSSGVKESSEHANEIDVDNEGRIRVLFHFEENNATSTYVRLSNFFSGDGYGSQFLPRVNSEVLVSFINGDIDKPIIIGSVHNGENKNPYNLPKEKTKSFIKTHSIPAHEEEFGYNELSFEDKRGEEVLGLRAQKDFKLHAQNNQYINIDNNSQSVIGNDEDITIKNNYTKIVGKNSTRTIKVNDIKVVEKEEIHTIKEDKELHVLKDFNTIVKDNQKTIVEHDMITRVKGILHQYVQDDVKHKLLKNLFIQVGRDYRLDVQNAYHLKSSTIKHTTGTFEIEASNGITLRCGGSVLTVDGSGIHLKAPIVDTASSNSGVSAKAIHKPLIEKPLYNKIRVTNLSVDVTKQNDIKDVLTFKAEVEVYENDAWIAKTELNETQKSQVIWAFIKNNDKSDRDILTDNPMNDVISDNGLVLTVNIQEDNIYKFTHVHAYVVDPEDEGYVISELQRYLEVDDIATEYSSKEEGTCTAILNIDEPREEEISQIRWNINDNDKADYNAKEEITHNLKDEKVRETIFKAYIDGKKEDAAVAELVYDERSEEKVKENAK